MLPAAPTRFSTSTGWPSRSESLGARMRELMSVGPPGANGTTQRIGCDGKLCAWAAHAKTAAATASVERFFTGVPPLPSSARTLAQVGAKRLVRGAQRDDLARLEMQPRQRDRVVQQHQLLPRRQ